MSRIATVPDAVRVWAQVDLEAVRHNTRVLRGLLKHTDSEVRSQTIRKSGDIGSAAKEAIPDLITLARNDPSDTVRDDAAFDLKQM